MHVYEGYWKLTIVLTTSSFEMDQALSLIPPPILNTIENTEPVVKEPWNRTLVNFHLKYHKQAENWFTKIA